VIEERDVRLARVAPEITGDAKRSMFRIYRDIRFSKDKSAYKTHAACWFYHRDADRRVGSEAEGGGAGFYVHVQPGASFVGGGIWMPPRPMLDRLRDAIAEKWKAFDRMVRDAAFKRRFGGLSDEALLKRMPRGFPETHPAAACLKYPSFTPGLIIATQGPRVVDYPLPRPRAFPHDPAVGRDGMVWYTDQANSYIGRLDPTTGKVTDYPTPTRASGPHGIIVAPDGAVWYTA